MENRPGPSQNPATAHASEPVDNGEGVARSPSILPGMPSVASALWHIDAAVPAESNLEHPKSQELPEVIR